MAESLNDRLAEIESAGLIRVAQVEPELEYLFRHALVQDAAYESLLKQDRRDLHRLVGETLEKLYADQRDELAPVLARHFDEAGDAPRAFDYYTSAGETACRQYANAEAVMHLSRALALADEAGANGEQMLHLYTRKGRALELDGRYDEAMATYEALEAVGRERGDRSLELASLMSRATVSSTSTPHYDPEKGQAFADRALALARKVGDQQAEARALWNRMLIARTRMNLPEALESGGQALALARELGLRELVAFVLNDLTSIYATVGRVNDARAAGEEALRLWRELGNRPMQADALVTLAQIFYMTGDNDSAWRFANEGLEVSRAIDNAWGQAYSGQFVGWIAVERGQIGLGLKHAYEAIQLADAAGFAFAMIIGRSILAMVYARLGDGQRAQVILDEAEELVRSRPSDFPARVSLARAAVLLTCGDTERAKSVFAEARQNLREGDALSMTLMASTAAAMHSARGDHQSAVQQVDQLVSRMPGDLKGNRFVYEALLTRARGLMALGRLKEARDSLTALRDEQTARGMRGSLWETLAALAEIETGRGDSQAAEEHRRSEERRVGKECRSRWSPYH